MSRLRFLILPILLGLVGGILGWLRYDLGMSVKWWDLPTDLLRPQKPVDILGGDFDADGLPYVYVETDDGRFYSCQRPAPFLILDTCWVETDAPQIGAHDKGCEANPKDVARHRRLVISAPPGTEIERIHLERCGASPGVYEYVLFTDGTMMVWSFAPTESWKPIGIAISVGLGGCPGLLVGLVLSTLGWWWLQRRRSAVEVEG